jgi:hypothetical protein
MDNLPETRNKISVQFIRVRGNFVARNYFLGGNAMSKISEKIIGKLSDDAVMSCSRLPALLGVSGFSTPNDELRKSIAALDARAKGLPDPERESAGEAADWGNKMENEILRATAERLKCAIDYQITERVQHDELPLQGSLDGVLATSIDRVIEHNPPAGIYVVGADSIALDGPGIAEAKLTGVMPLPDPAPYRGPWQCQALMMCTGYKWAAIGTLYRGTELRIYLMSADPVMQSKIRGDVLDFAERLADYQKNGVVDWFPALSSNDARDTFRVVEDDLPAIQLDQEDSDLVMDLIAARQAQSAAKKLIEAAQTRIMDRMSLHPTAFAMNENGEVFAEVTWGMSAARKEYTVSAQPAKRAGTLKIKELDG